MTLVARLSTLLIVFLLLGCSQEKVQVIEGSIYGTTYSVQFTENIDKEEIHTLVRAELDRIDMVFSTYKEDSEISKINYCRTTAECDGFLLMENTPSADEFKYLYEHQTAKSTPQSFSDKSILPTACAKSNPTIILYL